MGGDKLKKSGAYLGYEDAYKAIVESDVEDDNVFKNKVDSASNIYLNTNNSTNNNNSNNGSVYGEKNGNNCGVTNNGNGNENNTIEGEGQNSYGNNRLKKFFSEINGGGFKF